MQSAEDVVRHVLKECWIEFKVMDDDRFYIVVDGGTRLTAAQAKVMADWLTGKDAPAHREDRPWWGRVKEVFGGKATTG